MTKLPPLLTLFATLTVLLASNTWAQDELKLSPIEIQDLSDDERDGKPTQDAPDPSGSAIRGEIEGAAADEQMLESDGVPDVDPDPETAETLKSILGAEAPLIEALDSRSQLTLEQLSRLRRPMNQLALGDLDQDLDGYVDPLSAWPELQNLPHRVIGAADDLDLSPVTPRTTYCRRRLYFEDAALERCGQSDGCCPTGIWTNGRSAAKFLIDTGLLPCRMVKRHPDELVRATAL